MGRKGAARRSFERAHLDRDDVKIAMDMFYGEMGWERTSGAPTSQTYRKFGLDKVAEKLEKRRLLP